WRFANPIGDHRALLQLEIEGSADEFLWHLEQLLGKRYQLFRRQAAMSLIHGLGQRVGNPRANPHHGRLLDSELHGDRIGGLEADAADITRQPIRVFRHLCLDRIKYPLAESPHKLFGVDGADASDHAGAQVFLDPVDRRWRGGAHEARLELLAMGMVVDPFAGCSDPLTSRNGRGMPNDRYQFAVPSCLDPENAEAVVVI